MRFYEIPENAFDGFQVEAGMLLNKFDPETGDFQNDDILTATTGGVNVVCQAEYSDYGEDVDNCPPNMMELKRLNGWTCTIGTTALGTSARVIRMSLGAADIEASSGAIVPRQELKMSDFSDLWFVGQKANGSFLAVQLMNALSTGGFNLQTSKAGKGQIALEITGHVSIKAQNVVPMKFYSTDAPEGTGEDVA